MMDPMLNARWVRERRIEVVAPVATLQTELGEWTLRARRRAGRRPGARGPARPRDRRRRAGADRGRARRPLRRRRARAARAGVGRTASRRWRSGRRRRATVDVLLRDERGGDGARRGRRLARARRAVVARRRVRLRRRRARRHRPVLGRADASTRRARCWPSSRRPSDWPKPPPIRAVDASIYELHIRDFSIGDTTRAARSTAAPTSRSRTTPPACATCARWPRRA